MPPPDPATTSVSGFRRAWPHLRGVLVAVHLFAILLVALPAPVGGMRRSAWSDPTVQAELTTWSRILGVEKDLLEERVWKLASAWMDLRSAILKPLRPYIEATGADQPWRMFVAPHRHPARYQVQVRAGKATEGDAGWTTVFEERSSEHRWRASFFEQERIRSMVFRWSWSSYSVDAHRACKWIAGELFVERSDVDEVRCRFWKAPSPSPGEARAGVVPDGRWVQVKVIRRAPPPRDARDLLRLRKRGVFGRTQEGADP